MKTWFDGLKWAEAEYSKNLANVELSKKISVIGCTEIKSPISEFDRGVYDYIKHAQHIGRIKAAPTRPLRLRLIAVIYSREECALNKERGKGIVWGKSAFGKWHVVD